MCSACVRIVVLYTSSTFCTKTNPFHQFQSAHNHVVGYLRHKCQQGIPENRSWDSRRKELTRTNQRLVLGKTRRHPAATLQEWIPWKSKHSRGRCQKQKWYLQTCRGKYAVRNHLMVLYYSCFS